MEQAGENADVEIRTQKTLAAVSGKAPTVLRKFGTSLSVNSNNAAPKPQVIGKPQGSSLMSNANAPHLTAQNRAEPITRDNVTPGDVLGALDINSGDR